LATKGPATQKNFSKIAIVLAQLVATGAKVRVPLMVVGGAIGRALNMTAG
jgi:hypothetical protein